MHACVIMFCAQSDHPHRCVMYVVRMVSRPEVDQAFGFDAKCLEAAEMDKFARKFWDVAYRGTIENVFESVEQQLWRRAEVTTERLQQSDILVMGPSCQPWSKMKYCGGNTAATVDEDPKQVAPVDYGLGAVPVQKTENQTRQILNPGFDPY